MTTDYKTDKELAYLLKKGDITAFDKIYEKYSNRIYLFIFGIIKSQKDAEDIVQEVFINIWNKREKINEHLSFQSFIFTIAHNSTISLLRKKTTENSFIDYVKSIQNPLETKSAETDIEFNELKTQLEKTLEKLPKRQREVYTLSREEELTYKEIAKKMEISVNTVENHIVKALKFIRENMATTNYLSAIFYALFIEY